MATSKNKMGVIGHAVATISMEVFHDHLGIKFIFAVMNNVIVETNAFKKLFMRDMISETFFRLKNFYLKEILGQDKLLSDLSAERY